MTLPKHVETTPKGITFYSNYASYGIHSYISEDGTIQTEKTYRYFPRSSNRVKMNKVIIAVLLVIVSFVLSFLLDFLGIFQATLAFLFLAYGNFFLLCEYSFEAHINKKSTGQQFYAAKNMVFNAYEMLQGIPNLWELQKVSKFAYDSDLYLIILQTFRGLIASTFFIFFEYTTVFKILWLYFVASTIATIISKILHKTKIFMYLEWLFLAEPTDLQVEAVIKGLEKWIESEQRFV